MAEAPNEEPAASLERRMSADIGFPEKYLGYGPPTTRIGNHSGKPIFLIPISCPDGALPSLGTVEDRLAQEIPAGHFIRVNRVDYEPSRIRPRCRIYILFRAGDEAEHVQEFLARPHERDPNRNSVEVEENDALLFHYQLNESLLHLNCNEGGQITVKDENGGQISFAATLLSSGMESFRHAQEVQLRNRDGKYLRARQWEKDVELSKVPSLEAKWFVELTSNALLLKSYYGTYLAASDLRSLQGFTGHRVLLFRPPLDSSLELVPVMEGTQVKLRTHYGTFLRSSEDRTLWPDMVTHDLPHSTTIFFDVKVVKRKEEGSATERHHETGEGNSLPRSPPVDSGLYRGNFWKLKNLFSDANSGRKDVLIRGGPGTTAFVRELCTDLREYFDAIVWISNPQRIGSELIREEILSQLILERGAFPKNFDRHPRMLSDHELPLHQKARCLIVVDNLDDRTQEKFQEISHMVNTCAVIFIARHEVGLSHSQIDQYGRELETFELEDRSYVPWAYDMFPEKGFPSPSKELCQLIVRKCERLPAAIVLVMGNRQDWGCSCSPENWEASIPSDNLCRELQFIQKVLEVLCGYEHLFAFLYLCVFPENTLFSCERVSLLWFAEGFLSRWITTEGFLSRFLSRWITTEGRWITTAEHIFNELLLKECIHAVQTRSNGQLSTFQVDNRVREIMVSLSVLRDLVIKTSQGSTHLPENARYLTVLGRIKDFKDKKSPRLSSLFGFDVLSNEDETTSEAMPSGDSETLLFLSHAEVLDLTGASPQMVRHALNLLSKLIDFLRTNLPLRYLSLSDTSIRVIPDFIGNLEHLEFLDARRSSVIELPKQVARLESIHHIVIYCLKEDTLTKSYNLTGFKASCGIGGLRWLRKLYFVEANYSILKDLGKLKRLRHLGITKLRNEHGEELCSSLERLVYLESLDLHAIDEDEIIVLRGLNIDLKHLSLHGRLLDLESSLHRPVAMSDPESSRHHLLERALGVGSSLLRSYLLSKRYPLGLTKIILRWSHLAEDPLAILGGLQNLVELELHRAYDGEQLNFKESEFPKLKILLLDEIEGLGSMSLEEGTLPCLENLTISRCHWLEQIPSGIEHVRTIRELTFVDMPDEFHEKVLNDHENNRKLEHIGAIYFTQWAIGHWETDRFDQVTGAWQENTESRIPRVSEWLYR